MAFLLDASFFQLDELLRFLLMLHTQMIAKHTGPRGQALRVKGTQATDTVTLLYFLFGDIIKSNDLSFDTGIELARSQVND